MALAATPTLGAIEADISSLESSVLALVGGILSTGTLSNPAPTDLGAGLISELLSGLPTNVPTNLVGSGIPIIPSRLTRISTSTHHTTRTGIDENSMSLSTATTGANQLAQTKGGLTTEQKVGIGVGVGLGVIFLATIVLSAFVFGRLSARRAKKMQPTIPAGTDMQKKAQPRFHAQTAELPITTYNSPYAAELPAKRY
ncbi:hypothetical protein P152DRAFT_3107 [Eremomyces bilateralis CBS 781.70]|uniref:Mid2 domain-containing protein n=1 Tax=Eremomyces bilateralis CBS 781.70 TaxID=1392243 RepID=A0A6G1GFM8_9PEZI|nr:uncharacterized protein P152DRAFT_3107 [Eremomyces bilateralis CBS 781.70]KAF1816878.1 hypothetical protein P152DRAFT_3107 [Eremomyces bilateralis CBS 781.70]